MKYGGGGGGVGRMFTGYMESNRAIPYCERELLMGGHTYSTRGSDSNSKMWQTKCKSKMIIT